jgi:hypothetical protein
MLIQSLQEMPQKTYRVRVSMDPVWQQIQKEAYRRVFICTITISSNTASTPPPRIHKATWISNSLQDRSSYCCILLDNAFKALFYSDSFICDFMISNMDNALLIITFTLTFHKVHVLECAIPIHKFTPS